MFSLIGIIVVMRKMESNCITGKGISKSQNPTDKVSDENGVNTEACSKV